MKMKMMTLRALMTMIRWKNNLVQVAIGLRWLGTFRRATIHIRWRSVDHGENRAHFDSTSSSVLHIAFAAFLDPQKLSPSTACITRALGI